MSGNGANLWPEGVTSIEQVPADLTRVIGHAFKILDWYENLQEEEVPPEWMWSFEDELKEWFEEVKLARESRYGGGSDRSDDEEVPMMSNELAKKKR